LKVDILFLLAKNLAYKSWVLNEGWYLKNFCQYWKARKYIGLCLVVGFFVIILFIL